MTDERGLEPSLPAELEALAGAINAEHRACETALRAGLAHAIKAGELLIEAKDLCPHGTWLPWLRDNFDGRERLARAYMQVARELPKLQAENGSAVADLSFREALAALAVREPVRVVVHHVPVPPAEPVTLVVRDVPAPPREPGSVGDRSGERVYRVGELWAVACRPAPPGRQGERVPATAWQADVEAVVIAAESEDPSADARHWRDFARWADRVADALDERSRAP